MEISGINGHGALQQDKDVGRGLAIDRDGLDADGDLFRNINSGNTIDGLMIGAGKEEMALAIDEIAGGLVELCGVQVFVFLIEIPDGGAVEGIGCNGRPTAPCKGSEVSAYDPRGDILIFGCIWVAQSLLDGIVGDLFIARIVILSILCVRAECVQTCLKSIVKTLALLEFIAGPCAGCFDKDGSVVFGV